MWFTILGPSPSIDKISRLQNVQQLAFQAVLVSSYLSRDMAEMYRRFKIQSSEITPFE